MPPPRLDAARRRRHREAVLGGPAARRSTVPPPARAISGTVVDASPHVLVLTTAGGGDELRLPMTPTTSIWYGGRAGLHALRAGREVIVRPAADGLGIERVWVDILRVTGTILSYGGHTIEVDAGPHRGRTHVVIPPHTLGRVMVRHPRLEPGYLIDVIGIRSADGPLAVGPGTSQPGHRAEHVAPPASAPPAALHQGTATWFGGVMWSEGGRTRGAAYPAVDPEGDAGGCADAPTGCVPLPYLSYGSEVLVRNECSGRVDTLPVIQCGCIAARYCDRCVECGTSPRGRIVELSPASFVDLGGALETGCFNVKVSTGSGAGVGVRP